MEQNTKATQKGLLAKLLEVQRQTDIFRNSSLSEEKNRDGKPSYSFTPAVNVIRHFHKLLTENGILLRSDITSVSTEHITPEATRFSVSIEYLFIDAATGETMGPVKGFGTAVNGESKGYGAAVTSAMKYLLMTQFCTGTADAADEIDSLPEPGHRQGRSRDNAAPSAPQPYQQQWQPAPAPMAQAPQYQTFAPQPYQQPYAQQPWAPQPQYVQPQYMQPAPPPAAPMPAQAVQQPQYRQAPPSQPYQPAQTAQAAPAQPRTNGSPSLEEEASAMWNGIVSSLAAVSEKNPDYKSMRTRCAETFSNLSGRPMTEFAADLDNEVRNMRLGNAAALRAQKTRELSLMDESSPAYGRVMNEMLDQLALWGLYDGTPAEMKSIREQITAARTVA